MEQEQKIAPGGTVTGNDKEDIASLLKQAIQEVSGNKKEEQKQESTPLKMTIGGEEREFKSLEEMQSAINSTLETYQAAYKELAGNIPKEAPKQQTGNGPTFDNDIFINKMKENPVDGLKYAMRFALFDGQVEDPGLVVRSAAQKAYELENQLVAYQFKQQQPELATMLADPKEGQKTLNTLTGVMRELGYNSLSVPGLEAGYAVAIQRGLLQPPKKERNGNTQEKGGGPPLMGRSGGFDSSASLSELDAFEKLPYEQRAAFIAKLEGRA